MGRFEDNLATLSQIAASLGEYRTQAVFVGGAVASLLITSDQLRNVRPTDDVDIIVKAESYSKYQQLIEGLTQLGFVHDMEGPICRLIKSGIKVDVMPTDEKILGLRTQWYQLAFEHAVKYKLSASDSISVVSAPMFLCTKLEAFEDRGNNDFLASKDIEDIIAVINGRDELISECWGMPVDVRKFLSTSFTKLKSNGDFLDAIPGCIPMGMSGREPIIEFAISQLAHIPTISAFAGQLMVHFSEQPPSIVVISMEGSYTKYFATRNFDSEEDFFACLADLAIDTGGKRLGANNELFSLKKAPLYKLSRWGLLKPLE